MLDLSRPIKYNYAKDCSHKTLRLHIKKACTQTNKGC